MQVQQPWETQQPQANWQQPPQAAWNPPPNKAPSSLIGLLIVVLILLVLNLGFTVYVFLFVHGLVTDLEHLKSFFGG